MLRDKKSKESKNEIKKEETAEEVDCVNNTETIDEASETINKADKSEKQSNGIKSKDDDEINGKEEKGKDKKDSEIEKLRDQLLRQLAEYDNYRKRTARERMDLESDIKARTITEFLPVVDNLERALASECTDHNYKKGIEMIHQSFLETLEKLGAEEIKTNGEQFNPSYHQAVQQIENDELESGLIAETFQKGYKIGEKIIRFAMVSVVS